MYAAGVSQRKAAEVMSFLLGHRYSHETISAMTEEVLQAVEAFRRRPLPEEMAFVHLDGLYLNPHSAPPSLQEVISLCPQQAHPEEELEHPAQGGSLGHRPLRPLRCCR